MKLGLPGVVFLTLFAGGPVLAASAASPAAHGATPAVWFPYDMIVDLTNLPRVYSCDDLYYKFRDVLDLLGAQHWPTIHTYRCDSRSPQVHLQFALAKPATGTALPYATMQASDATIDLAPGKPPSLLDSDCQLLQQMKDTLLPSLPVKVVSYRMTCAAPSHSQKRYRLQVQALMPLNAKRMADVGPGALPASASPRHPGRAE